MCLLNVYSMESSSTESVQQAYCSLFYDCLTAFFLFQHLSLKEAFLAHARAATSYWHLLPGPAAALLHSIRPGTGTCRRSIWLLPEQQYFTVARAYCSLTIVLSSQHLYLQENIFATARAATFLSLTSC